MALCNLIRRIAYPQKQLNTEAIKHGKQYETTALAKYEKMYQPCVKSGLVIHKEFPFIAASPDGIIRNLQRNNISIIEIKCPYKAKSFTETDFQVDAKLSASKEVLKFKQNKNIATPYPCKSLTSFRLRVLATCGPTFIYYFMQVLATCGLAFIYNFSASVCHLRPCIFLQFDGSVCHQRP